jgi:hypothetical protein
MSDGAQTYISSCNLTITGIDRSADNAATNQRAGDCTSDSENGEVECAPADGPDFTLPAQIADAQQSVTEKHVLLLKNRTPQRQADFSEARAELQKLFLKGRETWQKLAERDLNGENLSTEEDVLHNRLKIAEKTEIARQIAELEKNAPKLSDKGGVAGTQQSGGDNTQSLIYRRICERLTELNRNSKDYELALIPCRNSSAADGLGADFILINKKNGDWLPVDATQVSKQGLPIIRQRGVITSDPNDESFKRSLMTNPEKAFADRDAAIKARFTEICQNLGANRSPLNLLNTRIPLGESADGRKYDMRVQEISNEKSQERRLALAKELRADLDAQRQELRDFVDDCKTTSKRIGRAGHSEEATELQQLAQHTESRSARNPSGKAGHLGWLEMRIRAIDDVIKDNQPVRQNGEPVIPRKSSPAENKSNEPAPPEGVKKLALIQETISETPTGLQHTHDSAFAGTKALTKGEFTKVLDDAIETAERKQRQTGLKESEAEVLQALREMKKNPSDAYAKLLAFREDVEQHGANDAVAKNNPGRTPLEIGRMVGSARAAAGLATGVGIIALFALSCYYQNSGDGGKKRQGPLLPKT